jgi:superfamily II DNA or RNA helicase
METITIDIPRTAAGYQTFIKCKRLPSYRVVGRQVITDPVSYAAVFGGAVESADIGGSAPHLMPFQRELVERALMTRRFALFADCGLGKTPMGLAWAMLAAQRGRVLLLVPLAVFEQWKREARRWHGVELVDLRAGETWTDGIGILNWESRRDLDMRGVSAVVLDESSILKNHSGETHRWLVDLARNIEFRLALSATPAPNTHFEYACHAEWLGYARNVKEYCAQFFRKDGNRWILRGHAEGPFYRNLSTWGTYIYSPRALGYTDSTEMPDEPRYRYERLPVHSGYRPKSKGLFGSALNAVDRSAIFGEIRTAPGPRLDFIANYAQGKRLVVWVNRNAEEAAIAQALPGRVAVISGKTPIEERIAIVDDYRAGRIDHLVSKPSVMGWGVNLPECNHMVYSGFTYSFEESYQAIRRAHRYGREGRLEVVFPYTDPEAPILTTLREKQSRFRADVAQMQARFWSAE